MASKRSPLVLAAALAGVACAAAPRAWTRPRPEQPPAVGGARAEFAPTRFGEVFAAAVDLVRGRGLEIAACEAPRGVLDTSPVEREAPCGATTCLARETTRVKLGWRRDRVTVTREVWDATVRGWREQDDPSTVADLTREARALVTRIVLPPVAPERNARRDPCAAPRCDERTCVAARSVPAR
jgi:hypothetical protein